jgi:septum formation protein
VSPANGGRGAPLILASASPRRRELLAQCGIEFEVIGAEDAEPLRETAEDCLAFARRAAEAKASRVARRHPHRLVLGADTIVVVDDEVLGKPADAQDAAAMLRRLSGRAHCVHTGVALVFAAGDEIDVDSRTATSKVTFRVLPETEIQAYVATGEPMDKAGAYGIQGLGGRLVARFEGSFTNIVGLPMELVRQMLGRE